MNKFLKGLIATIKQLKKTVSTYPKSKIIARGFYNIIEEYFYSFIIVNFNENLTSENLKEYNLLKKDTKKFNKTVKDLLKRSKLSLKSNKLKGIIVKSVYKKFKNNLKKADTRFLKILYEIEKLLSYKECCKILNKFRKDLKKIGVKSDRFDHWMNKIYLETILTSKKGFPTNEKLEQLASQATIDLIPQTADLVLSNILINIKKNLKLSRNDFKGFYKRLWKSWKDPFDLLEMYINLADEFGDRFNSDYQKEAKKNKNYVFMVLINMHTRGCQICKEVLTLLKNGYPDGAMARWRSLHEVAIISYFIYEHGNEMAKRFLDYEIIETYKEAIEYQKHCKALHYRPLTKKQFEKLENNVKNLCNKYSKDFKTNYGWIPKGTIKKNNFREIEESINLDRLRPYYKMACNSVHAGPKALSFRLGLMSESPYSKMLISGPSNYGFADPGQNAGYSLYILTAALSLININSLERMIHLYTMQYFQIEISQAFIDVQFDIAEKEKRVLKSLNK